jgi:hypothetical protein
MAYVEENSGSIPRTLPWKIMERVMDSWNISLSFNEQLRRLLTDFSWDLYNKYTHDLHLQSNSQVNPALFEEVCQTQGWIQTANMEMNGNLWSVCCVKCKVVYPQPNLHFSWLGDCVSR